MENKISGVYKITNNITGDFYIGSSKNIKNRWGHHKSPSSWVEKSGIKVYSAFIEYGLDNFTFEVIEETDNLYEREQYWIDLLKPSYNKNRANGWNSERYRENSKKYNKEWYDANRTKYLTKMKEYHNRLCLYEGETLTLQALSKRFRKQGIVNPTQEAKKYLLEK